MTTAFYQTLGEEGEEGRETRLSHRRREFDVDWNPTDDIVLNASGVRPVLCYRVTPTYGARLRLGVELEGRPINKDRELQKIRGPSVQTFQEVIEESLVRSRDTQTFTFKIEPYREGETLDDAGRIYVSDIIIWYARS